MSPPPGIKFRKSIWVRALGKWSVCAGLLLWGLFFLTGCSVEKTDQNIIKNLDFALVEDSQVPEELKLLIEEKKASEIKMTFDTEDARYIVVGYGAQPTGGYSISVDELGLTSNAIYIRTTLIGPGKGESVNEVESYPYVVIKIEYLDKSVVFE